MYRGTKRRLKKGNKFCVEKVSINWKLCGQENLSTLCFESLWNKIDMDVPRYLDVNQKMEKSRMCENSLDENILIPSQYKSLQKKYWTAFLRYR